MNDRSLGERERLRPRGPQHRSDGAISVWAVRRDACTKTLAGGCGSSRASRCYVLSAAGVSLLSQLPEREQVNVN